METQTSGLKPYGSIPNKIRLCAVSPITDVRNDDVVKSIVLGL